MQANDIRTARRDAARLSFMIGGLLLIVGAAAFAYFSLTPTITFPDHSGSIPTAMLIVAVVGLAFSLFGAVSWVFNRRP